MSVRPACAGTSMWRPSRPDAMHQTPLLEQRSAGTPVADRKSASKEIDQPLTAVFLVLAFAALAIPVLLVAIPPLLDYPNHLVRLWLIAGGAKIAPLSEMYAVSWASAHTNVGIDHVGALLGRLVPALPLG